MKKKVFSLIINIKERVEFFIFSRIIKKYEVDFYYKDKFGILVKRDSSDNFRYIFSKKYNCDAAPMMEALDSKVKNSDVSIDVGANIGITSIWLAKNSRMVFAFEPVEDNILRAINNLETNNIKNVELIQKALSDKNEICKFNLFESYGHHSLESAHVSYVQNTIDVEVVTLDFFCEKRNLKKIDVLKIDVEGAEKKVLSGAENLLKNKLIELIIFEHSPILFKKQNKKNTEVVTYLLNLGYQVYRLNGDLLSFSDIDNLTQEDLYAVPS